jgi:hypothetical protein
VLLIDLFCALAHPLANSSDDIAFGDAAVESGLDGGAERFEFGLVFLLVLFQGPEAGAEDFAGVGVLAALNFGGDELVELGGLG